MTDPRDAPDTPPSEHEEDLLDESLDVSFPASDAPAAHDFD